MPIRIIKKPTETIDFSTATESEKEKYVRKLIDDQLNILDKYEGVGIPNGQAWHFLTNINIFKVMEKSKGMMSGYQIVDAIAEVAASDVF